MIEPASRQDAAAIHDVAAHAGVFSQQEIKSVDEMLDAFFNPTPDDDHTFLVYRDEMRTVLGLACYGPTPFTDGVWELYWICVDRTHQRNHVGQALIQHVCEKLSALNARTLYLETSDSDAYRPARAFYEREGFECVAHLNDFYARGEGKIIYRKILG
jgi:ribosomal protein S18 acetylase RimI-like enzyme